MKKDNLNLVEEKELSSHITTENIAVVNIS